MHAYSLADWLWCRGDPFGTCRLDSQLRLFLTGSAAGPELERVRFGRLRRNFSTHIQDQEVLFTFPGFIAFTATKHFPFPSVLLVHHAQKIS